VTFDPGPLADTFSFRSTAPEEFDPGVFRDLAAAVRGRRRVVLRYWSASREEEARREVDPYHLACVDGHWYLVGFCHLRGDVRMFAPSRVRSLELTGATFDAPEGFRIEDYLAGSFCVLRGGAGEAHRVRLRFTGEGAKYVRERTWHPSQVVEPAGVGAVVVGFELSHLREVERWALSWGADCVVLEPAELRERVSDALTRAAARYGDTGSPAPPAGKPPRTVPGGRPRVRGADGPGVRPHRAGRGPGGKGTR
jgi:predicted DNA-binding transcriptional regulator YafY